MVMTDAADLPLAMIIAFEQKPHVKHNALVNAIAGESAVQLFRSNECHISRAQDKRLIIQDQFKFAAEHMEQLIFFMPVVGHLITRVTLVQIMILQRKIQRPALFGFMISQ